MASERMQPRGLRAPASRALAVATLLFACVHMAGIGVASAQAMKGSASGPSIDEETKSAARKLAEEGLWLYDAGDYASALERFDAADAMVHVPTMELMAARCLDKLGRLADSAERYLAVSRVELAGDASKAQRVAQANAVKERAALLPRIPTLQIDVAQSDDLSVTLDGKFVPAARLRVKRPVNPGHHRVEATRGAELAAQEIDLAEGAAVVVRLAPKPSGAAAASATESGAAAADATASGAAPAGGERGGAQRVIGVAAIGVGGAGLVLGVVTGILAVDKQSSLDSKGCESRICPATLADEVQSYGTLRALSTVGFVGGLVCAAGGATLLLTAPRRSAPAARAWASWIGPASAGVGGVF